MTKILSGIFLVVLGLFVGYLSWAEGELYCRFQMRACISAARNPDLFPKLLFIQVALPLAAGFWLIVQGLSNR